ncbi:hypothetical protein [Thermofilum pendens]|uniref:4-vinyl reductase 4VR domain-containing protein n=1 Tax=Thermofilum pendens (strain DSM 2475 / Hrk 5) TaxID=368408 RepID=A1S1A3_THEPD|nr:hypothetical protein [Thermofilum pendens]ABL79233.1 hypothetical protein Tpen_1838 [Thermofilum pendens Hrk 5]
MTIREEARVRGLRPVHVFVASMLAEFRENGVLNFGILRAATEKTGAKIAEMLDEDTPRNLEGAVKFLAEALEVSKDFDVEKNGSILRLRVKSKLCRFCPKGVGGLELPGPLCPFPGLFKGFLEHSAGLKLAYPENFMYRDRDGYCNFLLEVIGTGSDASMKMFQRV